MFSRFDETMSRIPDGKGPVEELGRSWKLTLTVGAITTILGVLVLIRPDTSLVVLAILIGVQFLVMGLFRLIHALSDSQAQNRVLWAILGVALMLVGLFLIRHLHVTLLLVAALVGVFWIVTGIMEFAFAFVAPAGSGRGWLLFMGALAVIGGIIVLAYPVGSLLALALLVGIWLIVMGIAEMAAAWAARRVSHHPS